LQPLPLLYTNQRQFNAKDASNGIIHVAVHALNDAASVVQTITLKINTQLATQRQNLIFALQGAFIAGVFTQPMTSSTPYGLPTEAQKLKQSAKKSSKELKLPVGEHAQLQNAQEATHQTHRWQKHVPHLPKQILSLQTQALHLLLLRLLVFELLATDLHL